MHRVPEERDDQPSDCSGIPERLAFQTSGTPEDGRRRAAGGAREFRCSGGVGAFRSGWAIHGRGSTTVVASPHRGEGLCAARGSPNEVEGRGWVVPRNEISLEAIRVCPKSRY